MPNVFNFSSPVNPDKALYIHHFDVQFTKSQLRLPDLPFDELDINFNVISNNRKPYTKLSDMEGDGYIISAFGEISLNSEIVGVLEARLVYNGAVLVYLSNFAEDLFYSFPVQNMGEFEVEDSVTKIL